MDKLQRQIDERDGWLRLTVLHPGWFRDVRGAQREIEEQIMQLECEQLVQQLATNENSRLAGRLDSKAHTNLITPIVPAWQRLGKGGMSV